MQKRAILLCVLSTLFHFSFGLEYSKQQRYNPNTDFLLHEGGVPPNEANKNQLNTQSSVSPTQQNGNQNNGKRDYVAQFPQLRPPTTTKPSTVGNNYYQNSGKRAPSPQSPSPVTPKSLTTSPISTQSSGGKRDYVAPQFPTLKPIQGANVTPKSTTASLNTQESGSRRDYVAPQYPTLKPVNQPSSGKVKDLINFYDQNGSQNPPQKIPSYSSILAGSTHKNAPGSTLTTSSFTQPTPKPVSTATKPLSFSNVVSGPNPSAQTTITTPKPSTRLPSNTPTSRPGSSVLPSSIVNRNQNNQANNNAPTDLELQTLSEELLRKDVNNAAKYVTINYQEKTTSQSKDDKAPNPFLTISSEAWNIPTIQKFMPLLDNYERDTLINEYVTPQERNEENEFMDAIMSTSVIRHLMNFLKDKGYVTPDPRQQRDFLKQLWFGLYSRGKGKISSSGFEHVFVSEVRNGDILGLHNWIYFAKEELANRINYLGYLKYVQLNDKGAVVKLHFMQQGIDKPVNSMIIGTSPEMDIALYTLCFVTRADQDCKLKLANNEIQIITHTFRYRSKNLIGSAYPQIPSNWSY